MILIKNVASEQAVNSIPWPYFHYNALFDTDQTDDVFLHKSKTEKKTDLTKKDIVWS